MRNKLDLDLMSCEARQTIDFRVCNVVGWVRDFAVLGRNMHLWSGVCAISRHTHPGETQPLRLA
jgi:hypothetical protein